MSGLEIIGPRDQLRSMLMGLVNQLDDGEMIAEATLKNNGPGGDVSLTLEADDSEPELGLTAEVST